MSLISYLRRVGVFHPYSADQITDAETENAIRDHELAVKRIESSNIDAMRSENKLLESIRHLLTTGPAAERTRDPIAQLLSDMRTSHHRKQRN